MTLVLQQTYVKRDPAYMERVRQAAEALPCQTVVLRDFLDLTQTARLRQRRKRLHHFQLMLGPLGCRLAGVGIGEGEGLAHVLGIIRPAVQAGGVQLERLFIAVQYEKIFQPPVMGQAVSPQISILTGMFLTSFCFVYDLEREKAGWPPGLIPFSS